MTMIVIICDCFASDDHDHGHDDSAHRLEDICQLGDDGGVEGGEKGHGAQEVDLVLQLLQTWSTELLGIIRNYAELLEITLNYFEFCNLTVNFVKLL